MQDVLHGLRMPHVIAAVGLAGAALTVYCIYFDHTRRSAPDYKDKIRRRRREQARLHGAGTREGPSSYAQVTDQTDSLQAFFVKEMQLGEQLLSDGNVVEGVVHMANSVAVCSEPEQLLQIFRRMLSPELYSAIIQRLPESFASVPALLVEAMSTARPQLPEQVPPDPEPTEMKAET
ncbi:MAS20 protein import receptor [Ostertagia ostertagi]